MASLAELKHPADGQTLDNALILLFPGPASATGEDVAELHLHGGRSVVSAVLDALSGMEGLRHAQPGEFTRRAFEHGRIDLTEAEGLSDLLMAETETQRRAALLLAGGAVTRQIAQWQSQLLALSARLEAVLDFEDEGDVDELPDAWTIALQGLASEIRDALARPPTERLRDGVRVVIAGPPNVGKSTLLNALAGREAAITSPFEGTTRDVLEAPVAIAGIPFVLADTAGLRSAEDPVEAIGVGRAEDQLARADLIVWLGDPAACPDRDRSILVQSKADLGEDQGQGVDLRVSGLTGLGLETLVKRLVERSRTLLPGEGEVALNRRHRTHLATVLENIQAASQAGDLLMAAEELRAARNELDRVTGKAGVEAMLDALFGTFCIGK